ncbi:MAG TPA: hypothetical protein VN688_00965 [Gemmataceae bacterium]|nr:hypothetical protein [Gemmataceae bacterium]
MVSLDGLGETQRGRLSPSHRTIRSLPHPVPAVSSTPLVDRTMQ